MKIVYRIPRLREILGTPSVSLSCVKFRAGHAVYIDRQPTTTTVYCGDIGGFNIFFPLTYETTENLNM